MSVIKSGSKRLALSLTMVLAATTAASASAQSGQTATNAGQAKQQTQTTTPGATQQRTVRAGTTPYVYMLVPADIAAKQSATKGGCWAKIYDGENYMGDTLTLTGPISLADMTGPFGLNWDDRVNSIEVGSKATLTVFDNEAFRDQVGQFKGGQKVPDISKKLGFFDEFASIRLTCSK